MNTLYMIYQRYPFVWIITLFIVGILLSKLIPTFIYPIIGIILLVLILMFIKDKKLIYFNISLAILFLGWGWSSYHQAIYKSTVEEVETFHQRQIKLIGTIEDSNETPYGTKCIVTNVQLASDKEIIKNPFQVLVYIKTHHQFIYNDTLIVKGEFSKLSPIRNPGEFDYRSWAHKKGIYGKVIHDSNSPLLVKSNENQTFLSRIESVRDKVRSIFEENTEGITTGMLKALILGDKKDVDPDLKQSFVETGVIHVLAVSGLHVGYILLILMILTSLLRIPWGWDRIIIITGLAGFVLLTGGKPSVIRASVMAGLYVLAPVVNRSTNVWNIIAASAMIMLMFKPLLLFDLGFQLSYSAVISIVYFYQLIESRLPEKLKPKNIQNTLLSKTWSLFIVSIAAQIGTLPFTMFYFYRIPVIAIIANIIIVPLIGILVALGILILVISFVPYLGYIFGQTAWLITQLIDRFASLFSSIPFGSIELSKPTVFLFIFYSMSVLVLILFLKKKKKITLMFGSFSVVMAIWLWALDSKETNIIFLDVGQGDATIIQFQDGRAMLIDAGQRDHFHDYGEKVVVPVSKYLGIERFNWVVWTHPHSDHIGGMITVLEEMPVDTVWDTQCLYDSRNYHQLLKWVKGKEIPYYQPNRGDVFNIDQSTSIQIFSPDPSAGHETNINNMSIVMRLEIGDLGFFFTGDIEKEVDELLYPLKDFMKSDLLKVAHHGSITSTTEFDLEYIQPKIAVISVGERNKFDHPSEETIQRLENIGAKIYRTDKLGAIWFKTDGQKIKEVKWR